MHNHPLEVYNTVLVERYWVDRITVAENSKSMRTAIIRIESNFMGGVLIISTSYICPDRPRRKNMPRRMPLMIDTRILIRIYM